MQHGYNKLAAIKGLQSWGSSTVKSRRSTEYRQKTVKDMLDDLSIIPCDDTPFMATKLPTLFEVVQTEYQPNLPSSTTAFPINPNVETTTPAPSSKENTRQSDSRSNQAHTHTTMTTHDPIASSAEAPPPKDLHKLSSNHTHDSETKKENHRYADLENLQIGKAAQETPNLTFVQAIISSISEREDRRVRQEREYFERERERQLERDRERQEERERERQETLATVVSMLQDKSMLQQSTLQEKTMLQLTEQLTQSVNAQTSATEAQNKQAELHTEAMKELAYNQNTPRDLLTFDGNPLEYSRFIAVFEEQVLPYCPKFSQRLNKLYSMLRGEAQRLVKECLAMTNHEDGYEKARRLLKQKYDRPQIVLQAWLKKLTKSSSQDTRHFLTDLESARAALKRIEKEDYLEHDGIFQQLQLRLPEYLFWSWRTKKVEKEEEGGKLTSKDLEEIVRKDVKKRSDPDIGDIEWAPKLLNSLDPSHQGVDVRLTRKVHKRNDVFVADLPNLEEANSSKYLDNKFTRNIDNSLTKQKRPQWNEDRDEAKKESRVEDSENESNEFIQDIHAVDQQMRSYSRGRRQFRDQGFRSRGYSNNYNRDYNGNSYNRDGYNTNRGYERGRYRGRNLRGGRYGYNREYQRAPEYNRSQQLHSSEQQHTDPPRYRCVLHNNSSHTTQECNQFNDMSYFDRGEACRANRRCFGCFGDDHPLHRCKFRQACNIERCTFRHHPLLHNYWDEAHAIREARQNEQNVMCAEEGNQ